jgi:hypothetical protein
MVAAGIQGAAQEGQHPLNTVKEGAEKTAYIAAFVDKTGKLLKGNMRAGTRGLRPVDATL